MGVHMPDMVLLALIEPITADRLALLYAGHSQVAEPFLEWLALVYEYLWMSHSQRT